MEDGKVSAKPSQTLRKPGVDASDYSIRNLN